MSWSFSLKMSSSGENSGCFGLGKTEQEEALKQIESIDEVCKFVLEVLKGISQSGFQNLPTQSKNALLYVKNQMDLCINSNPLDKSENFDVCSKENTEAVKPKKPKENPDKFQKIRIKSDTDSDSTENFVRSLDSEETRDPSSSDSGSVRMRKKRRNKKKTHTDDILMKLLSRVDSRKDPEFQKYDANSGQSMSEYLDRFEKHCKKYIKGGSDDKIAELEKKFSGQWLKIFQSLKTKMIHFEALRRK